ncbi:MAG: putative transposase [Paracoccaceae bacterium]|jgi:putative transposase
MAIHLMAGKCAYLPWVNVGVLSAIQISPAVQRMAVTAVVRCGVGIAVACRAFGFGKTCFHYSPGLSGENERITKLLIGLTNAKKTWGFSLYLRKVKGDLRRNKRAYSSGDQVIFCTHHQVHRPRAGANLPIKRRKRLKRDKPKRLPTPDAPNIAKSIVASFHVF